MSLTRQIPVEAWIQRRDARHRNHVGWHRSAQRVIKRVLDISLSLIALVALLPLFVAIGLAVKLDSPGPVLYVSRRIGKRGRVFSCFKFRSMVDDAETRLPEILAMNERDSVLFKAAKDPRITRVGRLLRKYSLDELPQILNTLRGEMSLVGPRPALAHEVAKYALHHKRRFDVHPGLTGLWQVTARSDPSFERYIALDMEYIDHWNLWLDVKIMVSTIGVVLSGKGR
jgi:lipopolysaccharide/colanic/teichoic acid biosynthesis glycosyltransferase